MSLLPGLAGALFTVCISPKVSSAKRGDNSQLNVSSATKRA